MENSVINGTFRLMGQRALRTFIEAMYEAAVDADEHGLFDKDLLDACSPIFEAAHAVYRLRVGEDAYHDSGLGHMSLPTIDD